MSHQHKICFVSLGCPKNLVDSEQIISRLVANGYTIIDDYHDADLVIINTCGFVNEAIEESLDSIAEALQENGKVIVTGCLGAKKDLVLENYPEVLHISGPNSTATIVAQVQQLLPPQEPAHINLAPTGIKLTPPHYAYLKISEGCNHNCSFCIIPQLRGKLISRTLKDIISEAENLVASGVKELIVVSQDTAAYGTDLTSDKSNLLQLANALSQLGVWVRLHYLYPYPEIDQLLPLMAEQKILPYLDVPLQHANQRLLKLMRRPANKENMLERIQRWRKICPDLTIRSTFIVGFPGETAEEFAELLEFLTMAELDRVGCFKYSPVDGAPANNLPGDISEEIKEERQKQLMLLQAKISEQKLKNKIGNTIPVIVDEILDEVAIGRSHGDAPEIDGQVIIEKSSDVKQGDIVAVKITAADEYDLTGKIV